MRTLIEILIGWGPMLLLIAAWLFFMRRHCGTQQSQLEYMTQVKLYVAEHIAETRRLNANLERIANALECKQQQP